MCGKLLTFMGSEYHEFATQDCAPFRENTFDALWATPPVAGFAGIFLEVVLVFRANLDTPAPNGSLR